MTPLPQEVAPGRRPTLCMLLPTHWAARMGGSQYQAKVLLERLLELDLFDVHYVARRVDGAYVPRGYTLHQVTRRKRFAGTFFPDAGSLWAILRRISPDVIYQRVGCAYTGIAAHYARMHRRRMVWHVASDFDLAPAPMRWSPKLPVELLERRVFEYGIRRATRIVVQSRRQATLLHQRYGRTPDAHIRNFHPEPEEACEKSADRITVCWVSNMKRVKRPEVFVQLVEDCADHRNVDFVMIGAPAPGMPGWGEMMERAARLPNLRFLGEQPQEAVNQALARSHLLVNTSCTEGFANTFIQSWMRGTPVLSLCVDPDGVLGERTVGVCAGDSYPTLLRELRRLLCEPQEMSRMGQAAMRLARRSHGTDQMDPLIAVLRAGAGGVASADDPRQA